MSRKSLNGAISKFQCMKSTGHNDTSRVVLSSNLNLNTDARIGTCIYTTQFTNFNKRH